MVLHLYYVGTNPYPSIPPSQKVSACYTAYASEPPLHSVAEFDSKRTSKMSIDQCKQEAKKAETRLKDFSP